MMGMRATFVSLLLLILTSEFALAQTETGTIQGTIAALDARPLPGVAVKASSASLIGGMRITTTSSSGFYRFPGLPPGVYEVKAELAGFQTVIRKEITLSIITTLTVDFALQLQELAESIEVSGDQ